MTTDSVKQVFVRGRTFIRTFEFSRHSLLGDVIVRKADTVGGTKALVMKVVVQRVTLASVSVDGQVISRINKGLCVLVGIHRHDTPVQRENIVRKVLNLRVFDDEATGKRWNKSVKDLNLEVLCVSQFTLYCTMKGNKPDYHLAMAGDPAKEFYSQFLADLRKGHHEDKIKDGSFGAYMQVDIRNDGPVTIELESPAPQQDKPTS